MIEMLYHLDQKNINTITFHFLHYLNRYIFSPAIHNFKFTFQDYFVVYKHPFHILVVLTVHVIYLCNDILNH